MLFPELELHLIHGSFFASFLDISRGNVGTAEVHADVRLHGPRQAGKIALVQYAFSHCYEQAIEVGTSEVSPAAQFRERVFVGSNRVQDDILCCVHIHSLREIGMDAQKFGV